MLLFLAYKQLQSSQFCSCLWTLDMFYSFEIIHLCISHKEATHWGILVYFLGLAEITSGILNYNPFKAVFTWAG